MLRDISYHGRIGGRIRRKRRSSEAGMTLLELIIACAILLILSSAALPIAKYSIIRQKEAELRRDQVLGLVVRARNRIEKGAANSDGQVITAGAPRQAAGSGVYAHRVDDRHHNHPYPDWDGGAAV